MKLANENPEGLASTFVKHNLGEARLDWLLERMMEIQNHPFIADDNAFVHPDDKPTAIRCSRQGCGKLRGDPVHGPAKRDMIVRGVATPDKLG